MVVVRASWHGSWRVLDCVEAGAPFRDRYLIRDTLETPHGVRLFSFVLKFWLEVFLSSLVDHAKFCLHTTEGDYMHSRWKFTCTRQAFFCDFRSIFKNHRTNICRHWHFRLLVWPLQWIPLKVSSNRAPSSTSALTITVWLLARVTSATVYLNVA